MKGAAMLARLMQALARAMAVLGGLVLATVIGVVCASVAGRALSGWLHDLEPLAPALAGALLATGVGPIRGDFELVEAGVAFAIFAFLPWTQLTGGHAAVDVFTSRMGERANRLLAALWAVLFAAVLALIAWQLWAGTQDKLRYGETTFMIQFPVWWSYAASLAGAAVAALVAVYVALVRVAEAATGEVILPEREADH
jgi:TRAP-type C4-dicarboxylate transport system permease small subunit